LNVSPKYHSGSSYFREPADLKSRIKLRRPPDVIAD